MANSFLFSISTWIWILTGAVGLAGVVLLIIAKRKCSPAGLWHDIWRDLGIALLVAAVVSSVYELHTRSMLDLVKIESVLKTVLASNLPEEAWEQVNTEILQRIVARRNFVIRLKLQKDPDLPGTQRVLSMENDYELHSLKSQSTRFLLQAAVDHEMWNDKKNLPRFESVSVGTITLQGNELSQHVNKDGIFSLPDVKLEGKSGQPVRVVIKRLEITHKPGTYHLIFPELTQGVRVFFDELPDDVTATVKIWSDKGFLALQPVGDRIWYFDGFMLPGQSVALRFENKASQSLVSPTTLSSDK